MLGFLMDLRVEDKYYFDGTHNVLFNNNNNKSKICKWQMIGMYMYMDTAACNQHCKDCLCIFNTPSQCVVTTKIPRCLLNSSCLAR